MKKQHILISFPATIIGLLLFVGTHAETSDSFEPDYQANAGQLVTLNLDETVLFRHPSHDENRQTLVRFIGYNEGTEKFLFEYTVDVDYGWGIAAVDTEDQGIWIELLKGTSQPYSSKVLITVPLGQRLFQGQGSSLFD